jgi:single-stranded DNA-binding protein
MSYLNSVTIVGFVGADPEQRQARNNGSKFTVLSVATQRSWQNAENEWVSKVEWHRVAIFRPRLAEAVLSNIKKGAHASRVALLARPTSRRMARARRRRPPNHGMRLQVGRMGPQVRMERDRTTRSGAKAPGVERQRPLERRCSSAQRLPAQNGDPTREAGSTKDNGKPSDARRRRTGRPCLIYRP